jgi:hypothetical protein
MLQVQGETSRCIHEVRYFYALFDACPYLRILSFWNDGFTYARYFRYRQMTVPLPVTVSNESERSDVISGGFEVKVKVTLQQAMKGPNGGVEV